MANACRRDQLSLRSVAGEDLADFEQRQIRQAAIDIALRRGDETGQQARPHIGHVGRDRIGQRQLGMAAAIGLRGHRRIAVEQFGMRLRDERPRHGLHHAARGQRALGAAGAQLHRRQHGFARILAAAERRFGHLVDAEDAHDLLDDVGLAVRVGAPGGNGDLHDGSAAGHHETEAGEDALHLDQGHLEAGEALDLMNREIDQAILAKAVADHDVFGRRAAARLHHELGRELEAGHHEGRIDAALEAVTCVGIDAELAAGLGDVDFVPQRRLDQHVRGALVAA